MSDPSKIGQHVVGIQSVIEDSVDRIAYDERMNVHSKHHLTMLHREDTDWIISRVRDRVAGKDVVEIGAGIGVLSCELARYARRVFAIEVDPAWSWAFTRHLYTAKPDNLTWIFDRAQNLVGIIDADVAIVVTGSDEVYLRELAARFAPDIILPWQDWNDGKAIVGWSPFGSSRGDECDCMYGCVLDGAHGMALSPRQFCHLRTIGATR